MPVAQTHAGMESLENEVLQMLVLLNALKELALHESVYQTFKNVLKEMLYAETKEELTLLSKRLKRLVDRDNRALIDSLKQAVKEHSELQVHLNNLINIQDLIDKLITCREKSLAKKAENSRIAYIIAWISIDCLLMMASMIIGFDFPTFSVGLITITAAALGYSTFDLMKECAEMANWELNLEVDRSESTGHAVEDLSQNKKNTIKELFNHCFDEKDADELINYRSSYVEEKLAHRNNLKRIGLTLSVIGFALALIGIISLFVPFTSVPILTTLFAIGAVVTLVQLPIMGYKLYKDNQLIRQRTHDIEQQIQADNQLINDFVDNPIHGINMARGFNPLRPHLFGLFAAKHPSHETVSNSDKNTDASLVLVTDDFSYSPPSSPSSPVPVADDDTFSDVSEDEDDDETKSTITAPEKDSPSK